MVCHCVLPEGPAVPGAHVRQACRWRGWEQGDGWQVGGGTVAEHGGKQRYSSDTWSVQAKSKFRSLHCRVGGTHFFKLHYGRVPLPRAKSGLQRCCCPGQGLPGYPASHSLNHTLGPWHHLTSEQGEAPRPGEGPEQVGAWAGATGAEGKPGGEVQSPRPLRTAMVDETERVPHLD